MSASKPKWIEEWRRRTRIISIMELSFELGCDCEVCKQLRQLAHDLESFAPAQPSLTPDVSGGSVKRQKKRKSK